MRIVFVGRDRSVAKRILLYLVTFGVSRRVWLHRVNKEIDGHEAIGLNHRLSAFLLCLPIVGPTIVAAQTAKRVDVMLSGSTVRFGPPTAIYLASWVPILGNIFYIAWTQSRLNAFWKYERKHPEHGIEIDVGLEDDPKFRAEIGRALKESYEAGSRFDRAKRRRRAKWAKRLAYFSEVRKARAEARAVGASTPMLPWLAPQPIQKRILHITCGRCEHKFDVTQDPTVPTPIVCPNCELSEVLPSLRGEVPERTEPVAVPTVHATCPSCTTKFSAVRSLRGPTTLACPSCGRTEVLPEPAATSKGKGVKKSGGKKAASKPAKKSAKKSAPNKPAATKSKGGKKAAAK